MTSIKNPRRKIALIGGTGLCDFSGLNFTHSFNDSNQWGELSSAIEWGEFNGREVYFLARHGRDHNIPPHQVNYRANLCALKALGVTDIIAVNAVGGISALMQAEAICIPDQIIDYTWGRGATFFEAHPNNVLAGVTHIDFSYPYDENLRQALMAAAEAINVSVIKEGVYGATQGPRLETVAEINRMARDGCDIVGMTGMPEAALARELEINYACLSLVVNPAAGKSESVITKDEIHQAVENGMGKVKSIIKAYLNA
jgi:5'-methylthioinosine phosphorylase